MTDIVFKLDPEIIIGNGTINRAGAICNAYAVRGLGSGSQILVASEKGLAGNKSIDRLSDVLADSGVETIVFDDISSQATAETAEAVAELARGARCSGIIGFGGPVTQSIAKITALIAHTKLKASELLDGQKGEGLSLPYIAIPTTARDPFVFSESFVAVDPRDRSVKLLPFPRGLCIAAVFDSGMIELPSPKFPGVSVFDGFCSALEAYCSSRAQFVSDLLLEEALRLYAAMMDFPAGSRAVEPERLEKFQEDAAGAACLMALGSTLSAPGIGTALVFALSGRFPVDKASCALALLPFVMERLVTVRPEKMAKIAVLLGEDAGGVSTADAAAMAVAGIRRRIEALQAPAKLREFNLSLDRLVSAAESARNLAFVSHSPWTVTVEDAYGLLKQAF